MKIQNPTVFLKDGELFCLTVEVPKLPYFVTTTGWQETHSKKQYQNYVDALEKELASAKSSAVKVKNKHSTESYIWLNEDGFMSCCNKRTACGQDRRATCAGTLKEGKLYTLSGYEAEVKEEFSHCTEGEKHYHALATITPVHKHGQLLPCPFCGSEPEWINEALADSHFYIRCPHCHIVIKEDRRDKAIGMWNNRKTPIQKEESQEELKEKIEFIKGAFQCYVGFEDTSGLLKFLEESKFTITRK